MLSQKYLNLVKAKEAKINVPDFILINFNISYEKSVKTFLSKSRSKYFIIRSAIPVEDSNNKSYAGHFFSTSKIKKEDILTEIESCRKKNEELIKKYNLKNIAVNLFIQEFIEMELGGVLFYPWKFFDKHFLVDLSSDANLSVQGIDTKTYLIPIDNSYDFNSNLSIENLFQIPKKYSKVFSELKKLVLKLKELFDFKFDVEFAFDGKNIYLLQLRPVTIEPISLVLSNEDIILKNINLICNSKNNNIFININNSNNKNNPINIPNSNLISSSNIENLKELQKDLLNWTFNDFSESLSVLSPLSYSLILKLYLDLRPELQKLHFKAEKIDFLTHLTNGQIIVNTQKYDDFFSNNSFTSSFKRAFEKQKNYDNILNYLNGNKSLILENKNFSYNLLKDIFVFWQYLIIYSYLFEKDKYNSNIFYTNEYELSTYLNIKIEEEEFSSKFNTLNELRLFLKKLFLFELDKLKLSCRSISDFSFLNFEEFLKLNLNSSSDRKLNKNQHLSYLNSLNLNQRYLNTLYDSIYDINLDKIYTFNNKIDSPQSSKSGSKKSLSFFSLSPSRNDNLSKFSNLKNKEFEALVIVNPNSFNQIIKNDVVLFAPYFRNEWISEIDKFKAIVLENGGVLSHSAIVAREKSILYLINQKNIFSEFKTGDKVFFEPNLNKFVKK